MVIWRYLDAGDAPMGASDPFDDQDEAEAWLTESWRVLLEEGVEAVELTEGGEVLYRMSLREESP